MSRVLLAIAVVFFSGATSAATIYECRTYAGEDFYSSNYCSQSNGVEVRAHSVPGNMSFRKQVRFVESANTKKAASARRANVKQARATQRNEQFKETQCNQVDRALAAKDAELRRPHSAKRGDRLTAERRKLMDQRFDLRC